LLLKYKEKIVEFIQLIDEWELSSPNETIKNVVKTGVFSGIFNSCLYKKILSTLEEENKKFNHGLAENDYPQIENICRQVEEQTQRLQLKKAELCQKTKDFINKYLEEGGKRSSWLEKVNEQERNDYYPEIEKLAKNIYLAKVQQILRELDNFLEEKNLTYEEIGIDYRETIKQQPFKELDD